VCVAPYLQTPNDTPFFHACTPPGASASAGYWPIGAITGLAKRWLAFGFMPMTTWGLHTSAVNNFGQPQASATTGATLVAAISAPGRGSCARGPYTAVDACVDGAGRETTIGNSRSSANVINLTFAGTLTSGQATVTGIVSTAGLKTGNTLSGTGIPSGT